MPMDMQRIVRSHKDENGATAVEYGLLVAAISVVIIVIVFMLGNLLQGAFQHTCDTIKGSGTPTSCT